METSVLISILIVAVVSTAFRASTSPLVPEKPQLQEDKRQPAVENPALFEQERILTFLSAFDEAQKHANLRLNTTVTGLRAYAKKFGKKVQMQDGSNEGQPRSLTYPDRAAMLNKDLLEINLLSRKNFRKSAPQFPKKSKKRACFWKYCVQSK